MPAWAIALVVGVMAVGAGLLVSSMAGERLPGESSSGSIEGGTSADLARARDYVAEGKALDAIKAFDAVLKKDPKHPEALAYRGWLLHLAGLDDEAMPYLDRAVAADPTYPDAHFFRGFILFHVRGDAAAAVPELQAFLANDPPQELVGAVESLLRQAQEAAANPTPSTTSTPPTSAP